MPYKDPAKQSAWQIERHKRNKLLITNYKLGKQCVDCQRIYPPYVMDWDHVRGEKKFQISQATNTRKSIKTIEEELAKCELVCANCHRIRTYERKQYRPRRKYNIN